MNHPAKKGRKKHTAGKSASSKPWQLHQFLTSAGMTHSRRIRKACSLRATRSPALLDPSSESIYAHLEDSDGAAIFWGPRLGIPKEEAKQKQAGSRGSPWGRRAASLRAPRAGGDEETTEGEASHSLGPGDGQRLIMGNAPAKTEGKVKKCKKVNRALRQGWETFLANVSSLTLSWPNQALASSSPRSTRAA